MKYAMSGLVLLGSGLMLGAVYSAWQGQVDQAVRFALGGVMAVTLAAALGRFFGEEEG